MERRRANGCTDESWDSTLDSDLKLLMLFTATSPKVTHPNPGRIAKGWDIGEPGLVLTQANLSGTYTRFS
jgi:hypothetical protein